MNTETYTGGCVCGALRYESQQAPLETGYCHCDLCKKSTAAPVVAFAAFPVEGFSYVRGSPKLYFSSTTGQREFCEVCGTQIAHRDRQSPETVDVNSGTLDDMTTVAPEFHIYENRRVVWFDTADELPRYPEGRGKGV